MLEDCCKAQEVFRSDDIHVLMIKSSNYWLSKCNNQFPLYSCSFCLNCRSTPPMENLRVEGLAPDDCSYKTIHVIQTPYENSQHWKPKNYHNMRFLWQLSRVRRPLQSCICIPNDSIIWYYHERMNVFATLILSRSYLLIVRCKHETWTSQPGKFSSERKNGVAEICFREYFSP